MKRDRPFSTTRLTDQLKADFERFAQQDGIQRGAFFDTSGNFRVERVSATATHDWLWKSTNGKPFKWETTNEREKE